MEKVTKHKWYGWGYTIPEDIRFCEHRDPSAAWAALKAALILCDAIRVGHLSIADLAKVCSLGVADGHDMMKVCLSMMSIAVSKAKEELSDE